MSSLSANVAALIPVSSAVLVPGYVWVQVESKFACRARALKIDRFYGYLLYSLFAFAPAYVIVAATDKYTLSITENYIEHFIVAMPIAMLLATVLGAAVGISRQKDLVSRMARKVLQNKPFDRLKISVLDSIDNAWDEVFSRCTQDGAVLKVTMNDGEVIHGELGAKSLASSTPEERDLFLQRITEEYSSEGCRAQDDCNGLWVSAGSIKTIQIMKGAFHD